MPFSVTEPVSDRVYVAQVLSLFSSVATSTVTAGIFIIVLFIAYQKVGNPVFVAVGIAGCVLNVWRISACLWLRKLASGRVITRDEARRFEAQFAAPHLGFAAALGAFSFLIFRGAQTELHMLTICVAFGYCAGVVANCGSRPVLALGSILLAIGPIICISATKQEPVYSALAVVATALICGAGRSMIVRYDEARKEIAARISSVSMARRDGLTSLPNRLALDEFFNARLALSVTGTVVAVHYVDLDGFKPVNDKYGHAAGDQLLIAVADRLRKAIRMSDMVARLGGDEFAIVQFGLKNEDEAFELSWRVRDAMEQPFAIDQSSILITASLGTIVSADRAANLHHLLQLADTQLYGIKRARHRLRLTATL
ncbi:diguanylate cyclase [Novosphingobium sp. 9U]|uniref:GGDEF domain-containing protein n=1 Tax=Novosphingobium sp. 9U TaxID=2653158 RepID=UPI00135B6692|nr:diguanylate cyclase [Novosphingobium sp. 9U]